MKIVLKDESLKANGIPYSRDTLKHYFYTRRLPNGVIIRLGGRLFLDTQKFWEWMTGKK